MGTFGITTARQKLGFTPATSVRANIRVPNLGTGGAVGQALVKGGDIAIQIHKKRQEMEDGNSAVEAARLRELANQEYNQFKAVNPQETWQPFREKQTKEVGEKVGGLNFSRDALAREQIKSTFYSDTETAKALTQATLQLRKDTVDAQTASLVDAFRSGNPKEKLEATNRYISLGDNMGKDKNEVLEDIKIASVAGGKLRANDSANDVYAAIEIASDTNGDFTAARELAKNPAMPETRQATLFSAINTAEARFNAKVKSEKQAEINTTTSTTIREYYQGSMTVAELDKRHASGLIKDSNFESMRKGLEANIPEVSDPFSRSTMNRAITEFKANAASRNDTQQVFLDNYEQLDESDRRKFGDSIESTFVAGIETSVRDAKARGTGLISPNFQASVFEIKFDSADDRRRYDLEWRNRNNYEDALDDWVTEQTEAKKDLSPRDIRIRANDLLIDYRKTKELDLNQFEAQVTGREKAVKRTPIEQTRTLEQLSKPEDLSTEQLQAEADRLRKKQ